MRKPIRAAATACLLAFALPVPAGDAPDAMKSIFLVARRNLPDPNFRESVVLVTHHGGQAPIGLIVNRRTGVPLSRIFPGIDRLKDGRDKLFFGGPVKSQELVAMFRAKSRPADSIEVLEGVYLSTDRELMREMLGRDPPVEGLRIFAGFSAWAPRQLESEIERGDWHLARADAGTAFEGQTETLWEKLERKASAKAVRGFPGTPLAHHDPLHSTVDSRHIAVIP